MRKRQKLTRNAFRRRFRPSTEPNNPLKLRSSMSKMGLSNLS